MQQTIMLKSIRFHWKSLKFENMLNNNWNILFLNCRNLITNKILKLIHILPYKHLICLILTYQAKKLFKQNNNRKKKFKHNNPTQFLKNIKSTINRRIINTDVYFSVFYIGRQLQHINTTNTNVSCNEINNKMENTLKFY